MGNINVIGGFVFFNDCCASRFAAMFNPAHPGELIRETIDGIIEQTGTKLTVEEVAKGLSTTRKILSAIINGKQSVTPEMAVKLSTGFANTSAEFWL